MTGATHAPHERRDPTLVESVRYGVHPDARRCVGQDLTDDLCTLRNDFVLLPV
jgi:hypothetical protein